MSDAGLSGNLRLVCAARADGSTYLAEQSFAAPMHISKSYWDGGTLLVHVINQTAGIFGGDRITTHFIVEPGARVLLSSPSASRFHPSRDRESRLEQIFEVRAGGSLDVSPELSIPQRNARVSQKSTIRLEPGAELVYLESLAPGRVASGETFAFEKYAWQTDIFVGDRCVLRERAAISPGDTSLAGLRALFSTSYYAGIMAISPVAEKWTADFAREIAALSNKETHVIAASKLCAHGWSIRILARDGVALQEAIRKVRALIYSQLGRKQTHSRRNGL